MSDRPPRVTLRTTAPDQTRALAAAASTQLQAGDVITLTGELGAGKTCLVQGLAEALGIAARITSPTFMLVKTYHDGALPLVHCDVYRLDRLQDVLDLGEDVMAPDAVTCIEWGDTIGPLLPADHLEIEILLDDEHDVASDRVIHLIAHGSWAERLPALGAACQPWLVDGTDHPGDGRGPRGDAPGGDGSG